MMCSIFSCTYCLFVYNIICQVSEFLAHLKKSGLHFCFWTEETVLSPAQPTYRSGTPEDNQCRHSCLKRGNWGTTELLDHSSSEIQPVWSGLSPIPAWKWLSVVLDPVPWALSPPLSHSSSFMEVSYVLQLSCFLRLFPAIEVWGFEDLFSFYTVSVSLSSNWQYFWSLKPSMILHETNPELWMTLR